MNILKKIALGGVAVAALFATTMLPVFADTSSRAPLYGPNATFTSCATGGDHTNKTFGSVKIQVNNKQVLAKVVIKKGVPNTTYDIYLNQNPGDCPTTATGSLTTDSNGKGWTWVLESKAPNATKFWVSAVGGGQVLRSSAVSPSVESDED